MKIREVYPEDHWSWEFLTLPHSCMRGALGTTAGQRWGSREPPTFRVFSVSWIRGSAPRKPFRSVSCKGIPAKGQHWLPENCPNRGRPHSTPGRQLSYLRCPGCQLCPSPQACQAGKAPLWWEPGAPRGSESAQGLAGPSLRPTGQPQRGLGLTEGQRPFLGMPHPPVAGLPRGSLLLLRDSPRGGRPVPPVLNQERPSGRAGEESHHQRHSFIPRTIVLQGPRSAHPAPCEVWGTQCEGDGPGPVLKELAVQ